MQDAAALRPATPALFSDPDTHTLMANNDQKSAARARREAATSAAEAAAKRNKNLQILAGVIFAALVLVIGVALFSGGTGSADKGGLASGDDIAGVEETKQLFDGVRQQGLTIGDKDAPVTIIEFIDVQCPFCRDSFLDELPAVVGGLVRTGEVKIRLAPLALQMMGEDSEAGRAVMMRLSHEGLAWNFANLFFFNQGVEGTGYVTNKFLEQLVTALPGTTAAMAQPRTPDERDIDTLTEIEQLAQDIGVTGTPSYAIGASGTDPAEFEHVPVTGGSPAVDQLRAAAEKVETKK